MYWFIVKLYGKGAMRNTLCKHCLFEIHFLLLICWKFLRTSAMTGIESQQSFNTHPTINYLKCVLDVCWNNVEVGSIDFSNFLEFYNKSTLI